MLQWIIKNVSSFEVKLYSRPQKSCPWSLILGHTW